MLKRKRVLAVLLSLSLAAGNLSGTAVASDLTGAESVTTINIEETEAETAAAVIMETEAVEELIVQTETSAVAESETTSQTETSAASEPETTAQSETTVPTESETTVQTVEETESDAETETKTETDAETEAIQEESVETETETSTEESEEDTESSEKNSEETETESESEAGTGDFTVAGGTCGTDYAYADGVLTILTGTRLTISTDAATSDRIVVNENVKADLVLAGVHIVTSGEGNTEVSASPLDLRLAGESTITLQDNTENILDASATTDCGPGVWVPEDQELTITGSGELTAKGGKYSAGIGGYGNGTIRIEDGTITAVGGQYAAGIGGSYDGTDNSNGGNIQIIGGYVKATAGDGAEAIGSGSGQDLASVTIIGGCFSEGDSVEGTVYGLSVADGYCVTENTEEDTKGASSLVWGQGLTGSTDSYPILTSTSSLRVMKVEFYLVTDGTVATEASATVYVNNGSVLASDSYPATGETGYEYLFYTDSSCEDGYQIIASSHTYNYNYDSGEATETVYMKKVSAAAYTVTIPATATLGGTATINATGVTVSSGKSLVVKLTGTSETDNAFKVRNLLDNGGSGTGALTYTLTKGETGSEEDVSVGDTILTVAGGTTDASGSVQLNFGTPTDTPQFAGDYTGTVTFTVSVEDNG
ncbi:MAG: hypothetical protein LUI14_07315 [Lachnospiraceae bacterium]|nr:hypothetical protein [Lachnospiraceae bacterium]